MQKPPKDKVCAEFCARFPSYRTDIKNEERVEFMLSHPIIRSKLNEWIGGDNGFNSLLTNSKKKTNVNNQFIEADNSSSSSQRTTDALDHSGQSGEATPTACGKHPLKNATYSMQQRELGNSLFIQKKLDKSLDAYNNAITFAPVYSNTGACLGMTDANLDERVIKELFPLSLANRSAVYFEFGEIYYDKSLADIALALKYGYPDRLRSKLLVRKANIYVNQKQWTLAQAVVEEIQKTTDALVNHKVHPDLSAKINEFLNKISQNINADGPTTDEAQLDPTIAFIENEQFENASVQVKLNFSEETKRHVISKTNLKKRDVIFVEEPFASVLLPQFYESHCHDCHKILEYFIPCHQCSQVKFCSEMCLNNAWDTYHKHECLSLDLLHSVGIAHLAIRIVGCAGLDRIVEAVEKHEEITNSKNLSLFEKGQSNYERLYSLLDHLTDMHLEDVFQYTLTAGLLTNWLIQKTSFFHDKKDTCETIKGFSGTQVKVGGCLLRHICQLICNAHAITDILSDDVNLDKSSFSTADESQLRIATAIFPAASMMNHSCDPNISFTFHNGKTLKVKMTNDVKAGEEIFNCYGPHWRRMPVRERQECISGQYFFECKCTYCTKELNSNSSFVDLFSSFKCEECGGPVPSPNLEGNANSCSACESCGHQMDVHDQLLAYVYTERLFQDGEVLLNRGNIDQALKIFLTCQSQYRGFLYEYHSNFGQLSDIIGKCYAVLGDFSNAAENVKQSLIYVEKRFGPESIEYGREVKKYIDLNFQSGSSNEIDPDELEKLTKLYKSVFDVYK